MRTVLTVGTFDVPHLGHGYLLRQCEALGDRVVVGINSDRFVKRYRGKPAVFSYPERSAMIAAMGYEVRSNDGPGRELIVAEHPAVLAIGMDWHERDYMGQIEMSPEELSRLGIALAYIPTMPLDTLEKLSATRIKERLSAD